MTTRKSFWKLVFQKNGIVWDSITEHVKEKGTGWMVLYAAARHRIFQENLITNPCGEGEVVVIIGIPLFLLICKKVGRF